MSVKAHLPKVFEQRIVYRLLITHEEPGLTKSKKVVCTYHNGVRIHGKPATHVKHPEVLISVKDQDEILWSGPEPFEIEFTREGRSGPSHPFYRPAGTFKAVEGLDGTWRIASGPASSEGFENDEPVHYKFHAYALDTLGNRIADSDPLDPHIVVDP